MPRKHQKDAHLPLIGYHEIEAGKIELARAIFAVGESENVPALEVLEKLGTYKLAEEPLPYLAVREDRAEDGSLRRVIVVRQNLAHARVEKSTELDAGALGTEDLKDPEKVPAAARKALDDYAEDRRFRQQVMKAPQDIRVSTVILKYLALRDPDNMSPEAKALREYEARTAGESSPWDGFVKATNFATQLIEFLKDTTLGQINPNTGENYKKYKQERPRKRGGRDENGNLIAVPKDSTIDGHLSLLNLSLGWLVREYRPAVRIEFDKPAVERPDRVCITWEELRRALLFCFGYIWDGTGYATERVFRDGKWHVIFARRPLEEYEKYLPVARFLIVYFLTGTRFRAILGLGWIPLNFRGWIDLRRCWINRNGRKSKRHRRKPKESSQMLPAVRDLFANWYAHDERLRIANNWVIRPPRRRKKSAPAPATAPEKAFYVVHDGSGNPVPYSRMQKLVAEVFAKVGIDTTGHKLKSGGVTTYHDAGFCLAQISFFFGTTERVLDKDYRKLKEAEANGMRPPPPDPATITLSQLLDPNRALGPVLRSPPRRDDVLDMLAQKAGDGRAVHQGR